MSQLKLLLEEKCRTPGTTLKVLRIMQSLNDKIRAKLVEVLNATNSQSSALNDLWFRYLRSLGYTGALQDMKYAWLSDIVAIPRGRALNDKFNTYLSSFGYTGSLNDQLYHAWTDNVLSYVDLGFILYAADEDYTLDNPDEDYIIYLG